MPRFALSSALGLLLISSGLFVRAAARVDDVGRIEFATAGVTVKNADIPALKPVAPVQLGDVIKTGPTAAARLTLSGGASVLIQPNSELRVVKHDVGNQQTTIELDKGFVLTQSSPDARETADLRVETPTAIVSTRDGSASIRTSPEPIGLGTVSLFVKASTGSAPIANADVNVVVQGVFEVLPVGKTNAQGEAEALLEYIQGGKPERVLPYPLIDYVKFSEQDFQVTVESCDDGRQQIYFVGEDGKLPEEPKKCRRQKMGGVFVWDKRKNVSIDASAKTAKATDAQASAAASPSGVGATVVTAFDRLVTIADKTASPKVTTHLLSGRSAAVDRGGVASSAVRFDHPQLLAAFGVRVKDKNQWIVPGLFIEFTPAGKPCDPVWFLDGILAQSRSHYEIEIAGTGTSTGNALQMHGENENDCAVYFMITDGTILAPRGMAKRVVASFLTGSVPSLDNFQRMITAGVFFRIPANTREITHFVRAYCVDLHKLAPHQRTEYKVSGEEDQKLGWYRPIVDTGFRLSATRRLASTTGHTLDSLIQWSLWTTIEGLDEKKFEEEFTKLVRKNYDAQKKKWDDAARRTVAASMKEMWQLVQVITPNASVSR